MPLRFGSWPLENSSWNPDSSLYLGCMAVCLLGSNPDQWCHNYDDRLLGCGQVAGLFGITIASTMHTCTPGWLHWGHGFCWHDLIGQFPLCMCIYSCYVDHEVWNVHLCMNDLLQPNDCVCVTIEMIVCVGVPQNQTRYTLCIQRPGHN